MFLQVHFLTSYHGSLLNRDDAGLAKRITFGGSPRLRVSSQCQKYHWRRWMFDRTNLPKGLRTRHFFNRAIKRRLVNNGMDDERAKELILHLAQGILHAAGGKKSIDQESLAMKQPVLFGQPEADYFVGLLEEAAKQDSLEDAKNYLDEHAKAAKKNFKAMFEQAGLSNPVSGFEGAMFGRFVTSDILARTDAPVHVAHAFTTHALETEVDYFTVVDDLAGDETGAAHANDMELGSGVFYGYVVVDIPLLVSNLTGCERQQWRDQDDQECRELLDLLIHGIAQVSPGAKLGATAPYARAECVVLETGRQQPRSLANAFLQPVDDSSGTGNPMSRSIESMADYMGAMDAMYGRQEDGRFAAVAPVHSWPSSEDPLVLQDAIDRSLDQIFGDRL